MKSRSQSFLSVSAWLAFAAWSATIWILSSRPADELHSPIFELPYGDKLAHMVAFAVGGFLLAGALRLRTAWTWRRVLLVALAGIALFGLTDEWHQLHTPGRSGGDPWDWLADVAGATLGALGARSIYGKIRKFAGGGAAPGVAAGD